MKILKSKGTSFTKIEPSVESGEAGKLVRGLSLETDDDLTPKKRKPPIDVDPSELANYVGQDYALILRQTISVLDKIIRKPNNLRRFERQAYIDRTLLSVELWDRLCKEHEGSIRNLENGDAAFSYFEETWLWKVHPYAQHNFDPVDPDTDKNCAVILNYADQGKVRADFNGRWHQALWRTKDGDKPDYAATADAIFEHLWQQEIQISKSQRQKVTGPDKAPTGQGVVSSRGHSIVRSANDPRIEKRPEKKRKWQDQDVTLYFNKDVSTCIFDVLTLSQSQSKGDYAAQIGSILYEHFGALKSDDGNHDDAKERLWSLHNRVRQFYQKLGRTERFRRAYKSKSCDELSKVLPANREQLLRIIDAKERNADMSELIRLGKLVVHASDIPHDTENLQKTFDERMDYFATSAGQSEIKRNEAFIRVWRNSVGLSLRTLRAWANYKERNTAAQDNDLAGAKVAVDAVKKLNDKHYQSHLGLIFGNKELDCNGDQRSRASIFHADNEKDNKELLWAMLRLAGELRNRINHYNLKPRLVKVLTGGVLEGHAAQQIKPFDNRKGNEVAENALTTFENLLAFDLGLQKRKLVDDLNQLKVTRYVSKDQLTKLFGHLSNRQTKTPISTPKFISTLRQVANIATGDHDNLPKKLVPFGTLDLKNLSQNTEGVKFCKIGLLRRLYASGFENWLDKLEKDDAALKNAIAEVIQGAKARSTKFNEEKHRHYALVEKLAESRSLDKVKDLKTLNGLLASESMRENRLHQSYRAKQRKQANGIEKFRRELFAYLFATYLEDPNLNWVWELAAPQENADPASVLTMDDVTVSNDWTPKPWHTQFYAWLYLVPNDDVSLLRHQFRKSDVLAVKAHGDGGGVDTDLENPLAEVDWLMGLYTRVQSAGFDGTEHIHDDSIKELFYEDVANFDQMYSEQVETHDTTFPGTRRGLRQVLRFGHYEVLEGIFSRHKITTAEFDSLTEFRPEKLSELFANKNIAHEKVETLVKEKAALKPKHNHKSAADAMEKAANMALLAACEEYKGYATKAALHNFTANAVRLTEHARLHQLMMRIVGRLNDFTLMWERDGNYLFLGMIYQQFRGEGHRLKLEKTPSNGIAIQWPPRPDHDQIKNGLLPLWHEEEDFDLPRFYEIENLLTEENQACFNTYFGKLAVQNPKDLANEKKAQTPRRPSALDWKTGKRTIRNDFAHYNVIAAKGKLLNLSYLVNAVRSLLSYDRKLKNAVSQAITQILVDEGLIIKWALKNDRLKNPLIMPKVEEHLGMVRAIEGEAPQFALPQASVRYTSMVKALFDFGSSGYRQVKADHRTGAPGLLKYPEEFRNIYEVSIPRDILHTKLEFKP